LPSVRREPAGTDSRRPTGCQAYRTGRRQHYQYRFGGRHVRPPTTSVYSATKAAVNAVTKSLASELGPRGIRVNAVNPGMVETEGIHAAGIAESDFRKTVESQTPLGRIGQPERHRSSCGIPGVCRRFLDNGRDVSRFRRLPLIFPAEAIMKLRNKIALITGEPAASTSRRPSASSPRAPTFSSPDVASPNSMPPSRNSSRFRRPCL
jgi:Enoyl-(Acyl carrier protein) reductase